MKHELATIPEIKAAMNAGHDVRAGGGGYYVTRDKIGQYLIKFEGSSYCVGLHGMPETEYADQLNGSGFYYEGAALESWEVTCDRCNSQQVTRTVLQSWSVDRQRWESLGTNTVFCNDCSENTTVSQTRLIGGRSVNG